MSLYVCVVAANCLWNFSWAGASVSSLIHLMFCSLEYLPTQDVKPLPHVQKLHDSLPSQRSAMEVCLLRQFTSRILHSNYRNDVFRKEYTNAENTRRECFASIKATGLVPSYKQNNMTLWYVRLTIFAMETTVFYVALLLTCV